MKYTSFESSHKADKESENPFCWYQPVDKLLITEDSAAHTQNIGARTRPRQDQRARAMQHTQNIDPLLIDFSWTDEYQQK